MEPQDSVEKGLINPGRDPFIRPLIGIITVLITGRGPPCWRIFLLFRVCFSDFFGSLVPKSPEIPLFTVRLTIDFSSASCSLQKKQRASNYHSYVFICNCHLYISNVPEDLIGPTLWISHESVKTQGKHPITSQEEWGSP